jgi:hypothetical protein
MPQVVLAKDLFDLSGEVAIEEAPSIPRVSDHRAPSTARTILTRMPPHAILLWVT